MFDIGFTELVVIAIVALVVLGPERLPKAARFAGLWLRKARNQWDSVKGELEREIADEELKRSLREAQEAVRQAEATLRDSAASVQAGLVKTELELKQAADEVSAAVSAPQGADTAALPPADAAQAPPAETRADARQQDPT